MCRWLLLRKLKLTFTKKFSMKYFGNSATFYKGTENSIAGSDRYPLGYYHRVKRKRNASAERTIENLSPTDQEILRKLQIEYEVMKAEGFVKVPDHMTTEDWLFVLYENSEPDRLTAYQSIIAEQKNVREWENRELHVDQEMQKYFNQTYNSDVIENTFLLVNQVLFERRQQLLSIFKDYEGFRVGQKIVFEINFPSFKGKRKTENSQQLVNTLKQIKDLETVLEMNRLQGEVCRFHVTNLRLVVNQKKLSKELELLQRTFPFLTCHEASVIKVFPNDELVLLHWSSQNSIEDHVTDIPVINIGETRNTDKLVNTLGIKHAHLPLHKYISFFCRKQLYSFTAVQTARVLQDFYTSNNWSLSLSNNLLMPRSKFFKLESLTEYVLNKRQEHKKSHRKHIKVDLSSLKDIFG